MHEGGRERRVREREGKKEGEGKAGKEAIGRWGGGETGNTGEA